jgi:hypothetical protein
VAQLLREQHFGQEEFADQRGLLAIGGLVDRIELERDFACGGRIARKIHAAGGAAAEHAHDVVLANLAGAQRRALFRLIHRGGERFHGSG